MIDDNVYIYIYIYIHTYTYIYIYIYGEPRADLVGQVPPLAEQPAEVADGLDNIER